MGVEASEDLPLQKGGTHTKLVMLKGVSKCFVVLTRESEALAILFGGGGAQKVFSTCTMCNKIATT